MASGDNFRGRALGKSGFANIRTPANPNKRTNRNNTNARNAQDLNKQLEQSVPRTTQADIPVTAAELSRQITTDAARVIRPVEPIEVLDLQQTLDLTEQRNETKDAFPFNDGGSARKSAIALEESAQEENDDGVARARVDFQEAAQTAVKNLFAPVREEGNGIGRSPFQDQFVVEGEATQAIMMFAQGNDGLVSSAPLTSFRCALNNEDVTDRDVVVGSPLYYDRLASTIRGSGYNLRNLVQNVGDSAEQTYSDTYSSDLIASKPLVASLFQTPNNKLLQIRAEAGAITYGAPTGALSGINSYQLYKHLPRVFAY